MRQAGTPAPRARQPAQARSQERVDAALAAAEQLVAAAGPEQASIPEIAKAAGIPRASLYQFFPDKYALLARLAERHLAAVVERIDVACARHANDDVERLCRALVDAASDYYDSHPVAGMLVLGGPWSPSAYRAQEVTVARIGDAVRRTLAERGLTLPRRPDVATLMVEMAFACMKHGYFSEGRITAAVRREAVRAQVAYFAALLDAGGR